MRPINRGDAPQAFNDYKAAKPFLTDRLGTYCSFCERRIPTNLAVEHILPKDEDLPFADLRNEWTNFLLSCVNCNSSKGTDIIDWVYTTEERGKYHAMNIGKLDNMGYSWSFGWAIHNFLPRTPRRIDPDFDATDDIVQGTQEGRFYHDYYQNYCFLPLYVFCGVTSDLRIKMELFILGEFCHSWWNDCVKFGQV